MIEEQIQNLTEKVNQLTQLAYELSKAITPCEQSSVSNHNVLTDIEGAMRITGKAKPTIYVATNLATSLQTPQEA